MWIMSLYICLKKGDKWPLFSCFSETDHLNYKVNFIGSIITQQYANQIHNLEKNFKINQLSIGVTYWLVLRQLMLKMNHFTIFQNTYGPHLKTKWDSLIQSLEEK